MLSSYDEIRGSLNDIVGLLKDEQKNSEDQCMRHLLTQTSCLQEIGKKVRDFPVIAFPVVCLLFHTLYGTEQQEWVVKEKELIIATSLLLQSMSMYRIDRQAEEQFTKLLFVICSRMKADAMIMAQLFETSKNNNDFPLFYLLSNYMYHEGKTGEYARTSILYLVDVMSSIPELERWMIESDLCTLAASGSGALYTQLHRAMTKLKNGPVFEFPAIVTLSNDFNLTHRPKIDQDKSKKNEYKVQLEVFISNLLFWQDMLGYCKSDQLSQDLLSHFNVLFVRQMLYPSIVQSKEYLLELITILRYMLEVLEHNKLSQIIVCYLVGIDVPNSNSHTSNGNSNDSSDELLNNENGRVMITLKDIVMSCLKSKRNEIILATLQLLSTLIRKYYPYLVGTLFTVTKDEKGFSKNDYLNELKVIKSLGVDIGSVVGNTNDGCDYESDIEVRMACNEYQPKLHHHLIPEEQEQNIAHSQMKLYVDVVQMYYHAIRNEDHLLKLLYDLVTRFYENSPEINLILLGIFIDLGVNGWLQLSLNRLLNLLQKLCNEYQHYSLKVESFDKGFAEFEKSLKVSDDIGEAITSEDDIISDSNAVVEQDASPIMGVKIRIGRSISSSSRSSSSTISLSAMDRMIQVIGNEHQEICLSQLYGNVVILREYVRELEAFIRVRSWLL